MDSILFAIKIQHDENTLFALSHMRYDLFCTGNRVARDLLAALLVAVAVLYGNTGLWGGLLIIFACFLFTGSYASSNRTARRISDQIRSSGLPFPCSEYRFGKTGMRVISMPEQEETDFLPYKGVLRLGEDPRAYYLFFNPYGGYMIPKKELGSRADEFRCYIEMKTGKAFVRRQTPALLLREWLASRRIILP